MYTEGSGLYSPNVFPFLVPRVWHPFYSVGATGGAGNIFHSGAPRISPGFCCRPCFLYLPSLIIVCLLLYVVVFFIKLLTTTEYLCHQWQRVCSVYSRLFSALLPNVTQRMPLVEQELLTRHESTRSWWSISSFMCSILL